MTHEEFNNVFRTYLASEDFCEDVAERLVTDLKKLWKPKDKWSIDNIEDIEQKLFDFITQDIWSSIDVRLNDEFGDEE